MDDIRHRFEPRYDTARAGIWCELCNLKTKTRERDPILFRIQRRVPAPDASVRIAAFQEKTYLFSLSKKRRNWRYERFMRRADRCLLERPESEELLFSNVLDAGTWRGAWLPQIVLLDDYIVDFYNRELDVAIEVDGAEHLKDPQLFADQVRDEHLRSEGTRVLRLYKQEPQRWFPGASDLAKQTREHIEDFIRAN